MHSALRFATPATAILLCAIPAWSAPSAQGPPAAPRPVQGLQQQGAHAATQLLLVTTPSFAATAGAAQRYERPAPGAGWRKLGPAIPVVVGRSGLGWRSDPHSPPAPAGAPLKQEGDGRAPAGVFALGPLWGYAAAAPAGVRWPYHATTAADRCVDDAASPAYNQLLPEPAAGPPWRSAEQMRRTDDLYRHLLIVRYNMDPPRAGAGSCIFVHIWRDQHSPTAGCTAMTEDNLLMLARWLAPERGPVLVQLPAPLVPTLKKPWDLP